MDGTTKSRAPAVVRAKADPVDRRVRNAACAVAACLTAFLALNTYWGLGGLWGVAWVLGCDCTVPLAAAWVQEAAVVIGIGIVLGRAEIWRPGLPSWIFSIGAWVISVSFALVALQNMLGDNTTQARFLFAPAALALSILCAVVARGRPDKDEDAAGVSASDGLRTRDTNIRRTTPVTADTGIRPTAPPTWARKAAVLAVLTTVPSGLWRMSMAIGVPVGVDPDFWSEHYGFPAWGTAYVVGLTLLLVGLASLTLGLVRPWGEVVPRRVPILGGRDVPALAAVIPAGVGSLALTLLWATAFSNFEQIFALYGLDGVERIVVLLCYAPLLLWGPLLAAVTASYARRVSTARPRAC